MASKFIPWVDTPLAGTNIQSYENFSKNDSQRATGFTTGTVASSIIVNSGLRQANLVVAALMSAILPDSTLDLTSDVDDLADEIETYFSGFAPSSSFSNYYTKTEVDTALGTKQATLVNQTNIKSINNSSLLGSGNMTLYTLPAGGNTGNVLRKNSNTAGDASWVDDSMITSTLTAGETTVTISNARITTNTALDFYTSIWGVSPSEAPIVVNGSVTLTFGAQAADMVVGVRIGGTY